LLGRYSSLADSDHGVKKKYSRTYGTVFCWCLFYMALLVQIHVQIIVIQNSRPIHSGVKPVDKREGGGAHNWGNHKDDLE
jgi:hypothetical protein